MSRKISFEKIRALPPVDLDLYFSSIEDLKNNDDFTTKNRVILKESIADYLKSKAEDITIKNSLNINLHFEKENPDDVKEAGNLIHDCFKNRYELKSKIRKMEQKRWRVRFIFGGIFLALCHVVSFLISMKVKNDLSGVLQDAFEIMGWVAIWEPTTYFLFKRKEQISDLSDEIQLMYARINGN